MRVPKSAFFYKGHIKVSVGVILAICLSTITLKNSISHKKFTNLLSQPISGYHC